MKNTRIGKVSFITGVLEILFMVRLILGPFYIHIIIGVNTKKIILKKKSMHHGPPGSEK